jgi:hypothetical protein
MRRLAIGLAWVVGCSRGEAAATGAGAGASSAQASVATTPAPAPSAGPATGSAAGAASWSGTYAATAGTMYVPDASEWSGVKFRGDDASLGLGEGALRVTVDAAGRARGTLDGPLGPLRMEGTLAGGELTLALVPSDATSGFAGTAVGHAAGTKIEGTMHLASRSTASVIRAASFSLTQAQAQAQSAAK